VFGLFGRRAPAVSPAPAYQRTFAAAVFEVAANYLSTEKGIPIGKDPNASIIDSWIGTRLEAISQLRCVRLGALFPCRCSILLPAPFLPFW
jgi:hypothetical protein